MGPLGRILIITGIVLVILGLIMSGRLGPLGRLPGDILIERENLTVYIPITTMVLLSIVVSAVLWLLNRF